MPKQDPRVLLKPDLARILNLSEKDHDIIAICFQAACAGEQTAYGPLVERAGMKNTYAFSIMFCSLAVMAHVTARTLCGFAPFASSRVQQGLPQDPHHERRMKRINADWHCEQLSSK